MSMTKTTLSVNINLLDKLSDSPKLSITPSTSEEHWRCNSLTLTVDSVKKTRDFLKDEKIAPKKCLVLNIKLRENKSENQNEDDIFVYPSPEDCLHWDSLLDLISEFRIKQLSIKNLILTEGMEAKLLKLKIVNNVKVELN